MSMRWILGIVVVFASCPEGAAQTLNFQASGLSGVTTTVVRSTSIRESLNTSTATTLENGLIELGTTPNMAASRGLVDFPQIVGLGSGKIPPGATIVSASLQLWCVAAGGQAAGARTVTANFINDYPKRLGTWREPAAQSTTPVNDVGVSWIARDMRPESELTWNGTVGGPPSLVTDPSLLAALPGLNPAITVVPNGSGGGAPQGAWHSFPVAQAVQLWAWGVSNQGFLLTVSSNGSWVTYASDDNTDASKRPKLVVTYTPPGASTTFLNRLPRNLAVSPSPLVTTTGVDLSFVLSAIDDDGESIEFPILAKPLHGVLLGTSPFLTYRPEAGYTGSDSFAFTARDAYGTAYPLDVAITVNADAGTSTLKFQEGLHPTANVAAGETRATGARWSNAASFQLTFEEDTFRTHAGFRQGLVHLPNIFGTGSGKIPLGSKILSATLAMRASTIATPSAPRTLTLNRIVDPLGRSLLWAEPAGTFPEPNGGLNVGISHLYLDATAAASGNAPTWHSEGVDVHSFDVAGCAIEPDDAAGDVKIFDVTQSLRAWSSGEPNMGWTVRNSSTLAVFFDSDDHATPANRPLLTVSFRPPTSPPQAAIGPHAGAGPDQSVFSYQTVRLDARSSYHPADLGFGVVWVQLSGPTVVLAADANDPPGTPGSFSMTPTFVAPVVATPATRLEFLVAAYDGYGRYTLDNVRVFVDPQPGGGTVGSPFVNAGADQSAVELATVTLVPIVAGGTGNFSYFWTKLSGPTIDLAGSNSPTFTFQAPPITGNAKQIVLDLAVTDLGAPYPSVVHDTVVVTVSDSPNAAPIADAGASRVEDEGRWVVLDASASYDLENHPVTYTWVQTAGPAVNLSQYRAQGTAEAVRIPFVAPDVAASTSLVFQLQVSDGDKVGLDTVTITVRPQPPEFVGSSASMAPYRSELTYAEARHLLKRLGAGIHPDDVKATVLDSRAAGRGLAAIVADALQTLDQLSGANAAIYDEAVNYAAALASPSAGVPQLNQPYDPYPSLQPPQIEACWFVYALRTPRPLHERMTRFWHGRLAAGCRNLSAGTRHWALTYADMLRFGVRQNCLTGTPGIPLSSCPLIPGTGPFGNYREMLLWFSRDPAVLAFIDGFDNQRFAPNENFAREFMELHTLSVFSPSGLPNYGEFDVKESARAFTGWATNCYFIAGIEPSCYTSFVPFYHDYGLKTLLGSAPTDFDDAGVVDRILGFDGGNAAARHLATGLLKYFVTAEPTTAMIDALKSVVLAQNWQIGPIVSTLLTSNAMFSQAARGAIVRSPVDDLNMLTRTLRITLQTHDIVTGDIGPNLRLLSERLGNPLDVDGFPKDLGWIDEFAMVRRSILHRRLLLLAKTPSQAITTSNPPSIYPDHPGHPASPVSLTPFLPPDGARFADETLRLLLASFDLALKTTPVPPATESEFDLALGYLNYSPSIAAASPFDGDDPAQLDRVWSLLLLLTDHPEFLRQ